MPRIKAVTGTTTIGATQSVLPRAYIARGTYKLSSSQGCSYDSLTSDLITALGEAVRRLDGNRAVVRTTWVDPGSRGRQPRTCRGPLASLLYCYVHHLTAPAQGTGSHHTSAHRVGCSPQLARMGQRGHPVAKLPPASTERAAQSTPDSSVPVPLRQQHLFNSVPLLRLSVFAPRGRSVTRAPAGGARPPGRQVTVAH